jgi:hypothetical protein
MGRRPGHGQPAAREARADDLRLPRERRRGQAARAPGAPLLGADRGGGAARRPRPVAHERLSAADRAGTSRRSRSSTPRASPSPRRTSATSC